MKTSKGSWQEFILDLGCNIKCTGRYSFINHKNPVVILSNGYGTTSFDRPVVHSLISQLEKIDFNWLHYRYPEREPNPVSKSLYISSGINTLRTVYNWVMQHDLSKIGLFGISFGANISIELALIEKVHFLILVNPVIDYVMLRSRQLGSGLLEEWQKKGRIALHYEDGQVECCYRFIEEAQCQFLSKRIPYLTVNTLVFQSELDELIDWKLSQTELLKNPTCKFLLVPNAQHAFKESNAIEMFEVSSLHFLQYREIQNGGNPD